MPSPQTRPKAMVTDLPFLAREPEVRPTLRACPVPPFILPYRMHV